MSEILSNISITQNKLIMKSEIKNILKSWCSSLERYEKLDNWKFSHSLSIIGNYLRSKEDSYNTRLLVRQIRDKAICSSSTHISLMKLIKSVLASIEARTENPGNPQIDSWCFMKEGQEPRFRGQTSRLFKEKLKFKDGMFLRNFDVETESNLDSRKVRRIIEKRMCQAYHNMHRRMRSSSPSNLNRYWEHRATAFQLYNIGQIEDVDNVSRGISTHWKKMYDTQTRKVVFKKKMAYADKATALSAIKKWKESHPNDKIEIHAYICSHCGKWHIGHYKQKLTASCSMKLS